MFIIKLKISSAHVANLFVSLLEGRGSPWLESMELIKKPSKFNPTAVWYSEESLFESGDYTMVAKFDDPNDQEGTFRGRRSIVANSIQKGVEHNGFEIPQTLW